MELDMVAVRAATGRRRNVGARNLTEAQEQAWGGALEIHKHVTLGGLISKGLLRALAERLTEPDLRIVIAGLREAAMNDYMDAVETSLGGLGFLVDVAPVPADEDQPYVWVRVKENFGDEKALRDRILAECRTTSKVCARKAHHCALCLQDPAIEPGDTYHGYAVRGEGTIKVCIECVGQHDLTEITEDRRPIARARSPNWVGILTKQGLNPRKIRARKSHRCLLCRRPAIKPGDSYYTPNASHGKVCGGCVEKHALKARRRTRLPRRG